MNRICLTNRWNIECFTSDSIHSMSWKVKPQKRLFYCELHKHHVLLCSILCVFKYWFYYYIMFWPLLCCSIVKCYCYGVSVTKQIWGDQLNVTLNNWNIGLAWLGLAWYDMERDTMQLLKGDIFWSTFAIVTQLHRENWTHLHITYINIDTAELL